MPDDIADFHCCHQACCQSYASEVHPQDQFQFYFLSVLEFFIILCFLAPPGPLISILTYDWSTTQPLFQIPQVLNNNMLKRHPSTAARSKVLTHYLSWPHVNINGDHWPPPKTCHDMTYRDISWHSMTFCVAYLCPYRQTSRTWGKDY